MTLWERCDQILKLIDKTLSEVAVAQTAIPTIALGPNCGPRPGRQETAPLAEKGQPTAAPTGAAPTAEVAPKPPSPIVRRRPMKAWAICNQ
jgi:hypothetical protein